MKECRHSRHKGDGRIERGPSMKTEGQSISPSMSRKVPITAFESNWHWGKPMFFVRPQRRFKNEDHISSKGKHFICKICKTPVSQPRYLLAIDGDTPYHTFYNPSHRRFDVMTLSFCQSVLDVSPPSAEYAWFVGYIWIVLCCASCYEHLGWRFESAEKSPKQFFAMIADKLETAAS